MSDPGRTTPPPRQPEWHLVVPVKAPSVGKSRLARDLDRIGLGADHEEISRALAKDTLAAACRTVGARCVVLVTSDGSAAEEWSAQGVAVVPDPGLGLNAAISLGLAAVTAGSPVAALLGDLPALTPPDLQQALAAAEMHEQSFVPDAGGEGTVMRAAVGGRFRPHFGPGSADLHEEAGATRLGLDLPRLRTDVDDVASLARALRLGVGSATTAAVRGLDLLGWAHAGHGPRL
ncbi:2-phospho-L-lactate guanylyltransferase [Intrasporangium calvum]|uniref:2-phospho-L-lactate guanylyltransferase CofC n=1 Tax=Intrasporangium calvum (strain ATCC 23552 / DSM 43043 / JCM 3097 / NBRC 12989 / NCIMB 10167 / NRRL B-3866 / 7 KIP) TaxID=710696 RepID=E6SFQ7_INTC7|nr:2-phospho-L-lactate guanylyltransferase [Intrasporangium calvum]ADU48836.1 2-phospho-L-lactate guanylyltransferase CofC [Intrasporangium calvum DSM 43043]